MHDHLALRTLPIDLAKLDPLPAHLTRVGPQLRLLLKLVLG